MKNVLFRAHEWLADHVPGVQYPNIRRVGPKPAPVLERVAVFEIRAAWFVLKFAIGLALLIMAIGVLVFVIGAVTGLFGL